jgi:hypothetical protein
MDGLGCWDLPEEDHCDLSLIIIEVDDDKSILISSNDPLLIDHRTYTAPWW